MTVTRKEKMTTGREEPLQMPVCRGSFWANCLYDFGLTT